MQLRISLRRRDHPPVHPFCLSVSSHVSKWGWIADQHKTVPPANSTTPTDPWSACRSDRPTTTMTRQWEAKMTTSKTTTTKTTTTTTMTHLFWADSNFVIIFLDLQCDPAIGVTEAEGPTFHKPNNVADNFSINPLPSFCEWGCNSKKKNLFFLHYCLTNSVCDCYGLENWFTGYE